MVDTTDPVVYLLYDNCHIRCIIWKLGISLTKVTSIWLYFTLDCTCLTPYEHKNWVSTHAIIWHRHNGMHPTTLCIERGLFLHSSLFLSNLWENHSQRGRTRAEEELCRWRETGLRKDMVGNCFLFFKHSSAEERVQFHLLVLPYSSSLVLIIDPLDRPHEECSLQEAEGAAGMEATQSPSGIRQGINSTNKYGKTVCLLCMTCGLNVV